MTRQYASGRLAEGGSVTSTLYLDTETFAPTPITCGTYRYAEDAEVMIVTFAWNDEPVTVWDLTDSRDYALQQSWRADLQAMVDRADEVVIQNSMFDRAVLAANRVVIPPEKIYDTMVGALSHGLPGSLDKLCDILGVPTEKAKLKSGQRLIHLFCKPQGANRKIRRATRETHPDQWAEFLAYAGMDIVSMREIHRRLPKWNYAFGKPEHELWVIDQRINDRGVPVDVDLAHAALRAFDRAKKKLAQRASEVSNGAVQAATQRDRVISYLAAAHGFEVADLRSSSIDKMLEMVDLDPEVREMLEIRQSASATAPAKYKTIANAVCKDGRVRGTLQFCGAARTGRDAGRLVQFQNLPRPKLKAHVIEDGIAAMKLDAEDLVVEDVVELCVSAVRGTVIASPGKKLVVADLANIEGRMLAWLAGELWKLDAFRAYDAGTGPDLYRLAYANAFRVTPEEAVGDKRQIGKVMELMLGFEGGVGAFLTGAATYRFDIEQMAANAIDTLPSDARQKATEMLEWRRSKGLTTYDLSDTAFIVCEAFKSLWRLAHPATVKLWKDVETAARGAILTPGTVHRAGKLAFQRDGAWLRMRLPSGRYLCYAAPEIDDEGKITFWGVNQFTRNWSRMHTYSGRLVENACQAASRDVLMAGVRGAEDNGYPVVMRVHDELICETPDDAAFSAEGLSAIMATNPPWAEGLPLAAAGFECFRYRKGD